MKGRADVQDPPEGFVQNYCLLIGDRSFSNFQKVRISTLPFHPTPHLMSHSTLPHQQTCYPHPLQEPPLALPVGSLTPDPGPKRNPPKRSAKTPRHFPLCNIFKLRSARLFFPNFNRYGPNPLEWDHTKFISYVLAYYF